jgi:3-methyladenine DNA glycosylase/8-oxoguanine DNA glycosylase
MTDLVQTASFDLVGPGGEPLDLWRTMQSHGVAELPPASVDPGTRSMTVVVRLPDATSTPVHISEAPSGMASLRMAPSLTAIQVKAACSTVRHILRMDEDLSDFYARIADDPDLSWVASGAGRMTRCATVFEEVIKTILTTNCAWSGTVRMVNALVEHLGEPVPGTASTGAAGRAFPPPATMASVDEVFYREVIRAGYRAPHLRSIAERVTTGELDLESLGTATAADLPDDDLRAALLALPGVGPYAASHIMMMLGRYRPLILDSWTRPTYTRLAGKKTVTDKQITRRFARYKEFAGLAFWLYVTRDWVEDGE